MKILVIGSGGREHALAWRLAQSPRITEILVAPGNAGTAREGKCRNVAVAVTDIDGLLALAQAENVAFTLVGPEAPLVLGVVDLFQAHGLRIFGPRKAAAQLEGSKAFAKDFLARHGIPTAHYAVFDSQAEALAHVDHVGAPIVIKADGLAAGKGVVVAMTLIEAKAAITDMLGNNQFGEAGARVVIEEFLTGEEASFISMVDGRTALPMATSQDHKRVGDGDTGPNTGGMGAYSPLPWAPDDIVEETYTEVLAPIIAEMAARGTPFVGLLYAGLALTDDGIRVIEFNARFGDPETQVLIPRLVTPLASILYKAATDSLDDEFLQWRDDSAVTVVLAAQGYPESPKTGGAVSGIPEISGAQIFHAGTSEEEGSLLSSGGRVLTVTGIGSDLTEARNVAYRAISQIELAGSFYRSDIAFNASIAEKGN